MKIKSIEKRATTKSLAITSAITLAVGIIQILFPEQIISFLDYVVGVGVLVIGLVNVFLYFKSKDEESANSIALGIMLTVLGAYFLYNKGFVLSMAALVFGLFILVGGSICLQFALEAQKKNVVYWKVSMGLSVINIILGVVILFYPFESTITLIKYIGIFMSISAVFNFASLISNRIKGTEVVEESEA